MTVEAADCAVSSKAISKHANCSEILRNLSFEFLGRLLGWQSIQHKTECEDIRIEITLMHCQIMILSMRDVLILCVGVLKFNK